MTYYRLLEEAGYAWCRASVRDSSGPTRVADSGEVDPKFTPRPVGFTADLDTEVDPITWEGDSA